MKKMEQLVDVYKLTPLQEGMLFHSLMDKDSRAYFWQILLTLRGDIDREILEESINLLIRRYDVLRTIFHFENVKQPLQIVLTERHLELVYLDISCFKENKKKGFLKEFCKKDREKGFDLSKDLLMRMALFKTGSETYQLVWSSHHIIMDGWCLGIFFKDLLHLYRALIQDGLPGELEPVIPYRRYIQWLEVQNKEIGLMYWKEYLEGYDQEAVLPTLEGQRVQRPGIRTGVYIRREVTFEIGVSLAGSLTGIAKQTQVPISIVFQTLWGVLLQKYNNTTDVVFAMAVSVRPPELKGIERMVGLFMNTVPVRVRRGENKSFSQFLQDLHRQAIKSKEVEYISLAEIQANSLLRNRLINHLMAIQNYPLADSLKPAGLEGENLFRVEAVESFEHADYDFNIIITPTGSAGSFNIMFSFNGARYGEDVVKRVGKHFILLMRQVDVHPEVEIEALEIVTPEEKKQILFNFNRGVAGTDKQTVHQLFEEQVEKTPHGIAIVSMAHHLSYRVLNKRADQLSDVLKQKGVGPDSVVGLMVLRSIQWIVGILGTLKAGGAWLPIDHGLPVKRIEYMLKNSGAGILLSEGSKVSEDIETIDLIKIVGFIRPIGAIGPIFKKCPTQLCYVIYTSGTTGKPKGTLLEHRGLANLKVFFEEGLRVGPGERILQFARISFDASVWEIFTALFTGASLYIVPDETIKNHSLFEEFLNRYRITVALFPPPYLVHLNPGRIGTLRKVITAGSATHMALVNKWKDKVEYINAYGPTETTICATTWSTARESKGVFSVPIGTPLQYIGVLVINSDNRLQPVNVPGELCIFGVAVGRGYLNQVELTAEKFTPHPVVGGECIYRTGDQGRWLPDGNIEFLGRLDFQVKVRGYRIELPEIEQHLVTHPAVKEAVVTARKEGGVGDNYLCAYIVYKKAGTHDGIPSLSVKLREYLSFSLPDYMIPARFVQLEKLPFTPTGKVDRNVLPEPGVPISEGYAAPADGVEETLAVIWADVLGLEKETIGTEDDFFMLGGHSLKTTIAAGRIHKELGVKIPVAKLFEYPRIRQLARYIRGVSNDKYTSIQPIEKKEYYPISLAQQRFFMLQQMMPESTAYNVPQIMRLNGQVDKTRLGDIFIKLIKRHESLRTSFEPVKNQLVQRVHEIVDFSIDYYDLTKEKNKNLGSQNDFQGFERPFDLSRAPLLRTALVKTVEEKYIMMVNMHHIICDGMSQEILTREFETLYQGEELPVMMLQYRDFSHWQSWLLVSTEIEEAKDYWLSLLPGELPRLNMPTDFPRPEKQCFEGESFGFHSGKELSLQINQLVRETGTTLYMFLLAVFNVLLSRYSGQTDIIVGSPTAGRNHPDLENIIGLLMGTLIMRNEPRSSKTFREFLGEVKKNTLRAYQHQLYPYEELLREIGDGQDDLPDRSRNPLFDVSFVVQNIRKNKKASPSLLNIIPYAYEYQRTSKVDLTLTALEQQENICFHLEYCTALFRPGTMERFSEHFLNLLKEAVEAPDRKIADFTLKDHPGEVRFLRCFIIGESTLPITCAEILLRYGHQVLGVISHDPQVITWCREKSIPFISSVHAAIKTFLSRKPFDYLLSINNEHLLSPEILGLPRECAINFHDSPLPRYAGMHATTWALMNRETRHAVSWHKMDNGIDTGDILIQVPVEIGPGETAASLNMKCYEAAIESFEGLVSQLEAGVVAPLVQNPDERTYYHYYKRPFAASIIDFSQPAETIDALVRALNFGGYPNPVGVPKIVIDGEFFAVYEVSLTGTQSPGKPGNPGTVTRITTDSLTVVTGTGELEIRKTRTLEGREIRLGDLVRRKGLKPGKELGIFDDDVMRRIDRLNRRMCKHETFWKKRLGRLQPLSLPYTLNTVNDQGGTNGSIIPFFIPGQIDRIRGSMSQSDGLVTAFLTWLCRITHQYTFDTGWSDPSLRRSVKRLEKLFSVPVPLHVELEPKNTFAQNRETLQKELTRLRRRKTFIRDLLQRCRYPVSRPSSVLEELEKTVAMSIVIVNTPEDPLPETVPYFYFMVPAYGEECICLYNNAHLKEEHVRQLLHHFAVFLQSVVSHPLLSLQCHSLLDESDRYYQLYHLNDTEADYPCHQVVHRLFEAQVERTPGNTAVNSMEHGAWSMEEVGANRVRPFTYRELDEKANRLAGRLQKKGVSAGTLVGILADRSAEVVVAVLAILKAGGTYLPIDPEYPRERILYMIKDSNLSLLLTHPFVKFKLPVESVPIVDEDEKPMNPVKNINRPSDPVYVIYTSGSTGSPKGVVVTHQNLAAYIDAFDRELHLRESDTVLQQASCSFDTFAEEMYPILLKGGSLVIASSDEVRDIHCLARLIEALHVTVITCSPQLLKQLNRLCITTSKNPLDSVHTFISGGDVLKFEYVNYLLHIGKVYNTYGPTEATVCTTFFKCCQYEGLKVASIPIGRPIPNYKVYLLDENRQLVPLGLTGEICIAGEGVSRGYLNQPILTAEKFIEFHRSYRSYISYRTGDLARWLPGGILEFMGRRDHQVKIRGYRVELAEIESQLLKREDIEEAVVTSIPDLNGERYLCAYIVSHSHHPSQPSVLRDYLLNLLPGYMIPSRFVPIETLPLTPHGKINRKALPLPQSDEWNPGGTVVPPRNPVEKTLVEIWSEVLGIEERLIGVTANFFELGGHSLNATIMISKVHQAFHVNLPLGEVFKRPYIEALHHYIDRTHKTLYSSIQVATAEGSEGFYPLSSAQKRLFFLEQLEDIGTSYNMPFLFIIAGDIDMSRFEKTFILLIRRHEALRTSFKLIAGEPFQRIHDEVVFEIEYRVLPEPQVEDFIRPFDLAKVPLLRVGMVKMSKDEHLVMFDMHHIISDGTSMGILVNEFAFLYNDEGEKLPELRIQYKDFAVWQNRLYRTGKIKEQEKYWFDQFKDCGELPLLDLPTDFPRPDVFCFEGAHYECALDAEETSHFKTYGSALGATLYMALTAAFTLLLHKYTGQDDIIVGTGAAGRHHADLHHIIGMFVNTLAIRTHPKEEKTCREYLEEVKETTVKAFENQDLQFEELVDRLNLERDPSRNPLFDVSLVVQNFQQPPLHLKGLKVMPYHHRPSTTKFDLTLFVFEGGETIDFQLEYSTKLFKPGTIQRMAGHLAAVIRQMHQNPDLAISHIDIVTEDEKDQLLYWFNATTVPYPEEKTIHQLFEEQAQRTPDGIAVVTPDAAALTYRQLNEKANQVSNYLYFGKKVRPDDRVAILMDRSIYLIIAILGVLKAGGAYVPIDIHSPEERIKTIIRDAEPGVLLTQKQFMRTLQRVQWECPSLHTFLCMDTRDIHGEDETEKRCLMDQNLWDYVAEKGENDITAGGWISSYTGKPFSSEEMDEYGQNVLKKLTPFIHSDTRVLEIGCSSGITMYRIAPRVGFYHGIDISNVIIRKNLQRVKNEGYVNIKLTRLAAHEINQLEERDFDLIILNSVIQAFPGHNYLRQVIKKCIGLLKGSGYLFIGDIMDQDLKAELIAQMEAFKRNPINNRNGYKTKIDFSAELFVSPGYFGDLRVDFPEIRDVQCTAKIYTIENELTRFRYDALLVIDKERGEERRILKKKKFQQDAAALEAYSNAEVASSVTSRNLAYLIYTSGTTGKPKGVMTEHRGVSNLKEFFKTAIGIGERDRLLQFANIAFDASVWEIVVALLNGAVLHMIPREIIDSYADFEEYLERNVITVAALPPPYLDHLNPEKINTLKTLITAGSKSNQRLVNRWRRKVRLINGYGPTETTVSATIWEAPGRKVEEIKYPTIPIGRPILNTRIYILDESGHLQTIGVAGELCIAGVGVARGYLNQPKLTAEKFFRPQIELHRSYIAYRTGDLARWLEDGNIEFLGRIDHQVKIRGFRIELSEIESHLLHHEGVNEAVVLAREDNRKEKYLCAYIVPNEVGAAELREYLSGYLPGYMIPNYFLMVDKIPLSPIGKINRKSLPLPSMGDVLGGAYDAPVDDVEKKLVEIWADILQIEKEKMGRDTGFFDVGGHSLNAITMIARVHQELNVKIPLAQVFKHQTIAGIGWYIKTAVKVPYATICPAPKMEYYLLSSAQKRMYLAQQFVGIGTAYNISTVVELKGKPDKKKMVQVLRKLIMRHECLRTSFHLVKDEPKQKVHDKLEFKIEYLHAPCPMPHAGAIASLVRPFDLSQAPLLRVGLIKTAEEHHLLVVDLHHIVSDGVSHRILIEELIALYRGESLPRLRLQYKDYARWQHELMTREDETLKKQEQYWLSQFREEFPVLNLHTDYPRPREQGCDGEHIAFTFDPETAGALRKLAAAEDATLYMVLLSLYNILLSVLSGQEDIIVGTPVAGRRHADLEPIVGMFVNTLAIRNYPSGNKKYNFFLRETRYRTLEAFENQDYPFEELVEQLSSAGRINRDISRNPLYDVMFGLQEAAIPAAELPGLNIVPFKYESKISIFDMTFLAIEAGDQLHVIVEYSTILLTKATIERIINCFRNIVSSVLEDPGKGLMEIETISPQEKQQVLHRFNNTQSDYPCEKTIHELFAEQAERTTDRMAVIGMAGRVGTRFIASDKISITYKELDKKANQLAFYLRKKGVGMDKIVGIMVERSLEMIVGLLGILKAGGAYLPIEVDTPEKRIVAMLEDSGAAFLLSTQAVVQRHSFSCLQGSTVDGVTPQQTAPRPQISDLDHIPFPDRSLVDYGKYHRYIGMALVKHTISIMGTRGCPYNCAYCHKIWPKRHIVRSAENIFSEVWHYYQMGIRRFVILDDIFNLDIKNSSRFFQLVLDHDLDLQMFFPSGLRGDILTKEYIDLMIEAGTVNVMLALESASPRIQELIGKNLKLDRLRENFDYIAQAYPQVILDAALMVGFPTETTEEALKTLNFIKEIQWLHFPNLSILKVYPNTDMEQLALANGVSREVIRDSMTQAFHEVPDTLPFSKGFVRQFQADFFNEYFLDHERLLAVLPHQMTVLSEEEISQKYDSYLPVDIRCFSDLLTFFGITEEELKARGGRGFADDDKMAVPDFHERVKHHSPVVKKVEQPLRVLLLDLSKTFSTADPMLYDVAEAPLGLMYLLTYLNRQFEGRIEGKIGHARMDFDNYQELKKLLEAFKPDVIGIRTLTFYQDFFHQTIALIRQWGFDVPVVAGGPYATSNWIGILQDRNIDLVVIGEGEVTFADLIGKIMENDGKLPDEAILEKIPGIAFVPQKQRKTGSFAREVLMLDMSLDTSAREPVHRSFSSDLAYVIFTSGSTGSPKGTLTTHSNVARVVRDTNYIDLTPDDRLLQLSTYAFDGSVFDIYGALLNGAALVMVPKEDLLALDRLSDLINKENITVFFVTTALFNTLVDLKIESFAGVRKVLFGGERVSVEHTRRALEGMGKGRVLHMYGPTETTVFATYYPVNEIHERQGTIPIGGPISNTSVAIFDKYLRPQPIGVVGELWIGGDGNARGYLNDPEMTNSKFQRGWPPHPIRNYKAPAGHPLSFSASQLLSFSLYRTGDLACWLPDPAARGAYIIEFIGRIDQQVKIRGFRIEPGEIEARLLKHALVKEAVVTVQSRDSRGGDNYLCAYVVVRKMEHREVGTEELKEYLLKYLPDYMVPAFFVILNKLPTTRSGKINRRALPRSGIGAGGLFFLPRDPMEETLAGIWAELLGMEKTEISINDDFFALGGHSLSAAMLVSRVHKELRVKIPMVEIFKGPSIKELSNYIKQVGQEAFAAIEPVEEKEYYALSPMQERLFVLEQLEDLHTAYNLPHVLMVEGELDHLVLEKVFCELIARHESLRTSFFLVKGRPYQGIHKTVEFQIEHYSREQGAGSREVKKFVRPFDLSLAPLLRVGLTAIEKDKHLLMVDMHHIISDGSSMTLLVEDFAALYEGRSLPRLRIRYRDFSEWQHSPAGRAALEKQETWWLETFKKDIPVLNLITDFPRPPVQSFKGDSLSFTFEKEVKERIYQLMKETNTTLYMVLLAALNVLLLRYSGAEDIVIGTAAAGREHVDFQQVIGLFINVLAMRNYPEGSKTFSEFLEEVKQNAAAAFQHQGYPYGLLLEKLKVKKDVSRNPLFDVELVVQNMEQPRWETKDLSFNPYDYEPGVTQVDMGFYVMEAGDKIHMNLVYCTDLFKKETIERLIDYFKEIMACLLDDPGIRLGDVVMAHYLELAVHDRFEDDEQDFGF